MRAHKQIALFFVSFVTIYLLLVVPWPGFQSDWEVFFLGISRSLLSTLLPGLELTSFPTGHPQGNGVCARIQIANLSLMKPDGSGPVRNMDFDAGGFWRCMAMLLALGLSTQIPWRNRLQRLALSLAVFWFILLASLWFITWRESCTIYPGFEHTGLDRFMKTMELGITQQFSIAVPVIVWVLTYLPGGKWFKP